MVEHSGFKASEYWEKDENISKFLQCCLQNRAFLQPEFPKDGQCDCRMPDKESIFWDYPRIACSMFTAPAISKSSQHPNPEP